MTKAKLLGQSVPEKARLVGFSLSAVLRIYQKWSEDRIILLLLIMGSISLFFFFFALYTQMVLQGFLVSLCALKSYLLLKKQ